ncbi:MAG: hypothetical protein LC679_10780 [Intrasporangiaceae bacterium]|nr:hypothetical protein [Intrasporangiaceae bacterium]
MVLDGYELDPDTGHRLRASGVAVLALQDGRFGSGQEADLLLDQNVGAEAGSSVTAGTKALLGLRFALFRDEILRERRSPREGHRPLRSIVFSGGTDPYNAVPVLTRLLLATGEPLEVTVVAAGPLERTSLDSLPRLPGQHVHMIDPTPALAEHAAASDLAVVAAGSSVWELLCIGVPCAVVAVADNQTPTIDLVNREQIAYGLGSLRDLRDDPVMLESATVRLKELLRSGSTRIALAMRAQQVVDGRGRVRVTDAIEHLLTSRGAVSDVIGDDS